MEKWTVFWFRRDLRLQDNAGLYHALQTGNRVLPIFIFDSAILEQLEAHDARVYFIYQQLEQMNKLLAANNQQLAVFYGKPEAVFEQLLQNHAIESVYTNRDYEPYARKRDASIHQLLEKNGVSFYTSKDQVIFEKKEVVKDDGTPYVVFTPFSKKWKLLRQGNALAHYPSENLLHQMATHDYQFPTLADIGFQPAPILVPPYSLQQQLIENHEATRNFPALSNGTSRIGPHLRFGTLSVREAVRLAEATGKETFLNELIWREFFMQILWHFPHTTTQSFKPAYDRIPWRNNEEQFERWCQGKTGYAIVDAGMRELNATGHMHNRVRMVVASFLCKHLLIDWRWGETYFAKHLLDYEQASNVGNWQWAAGSGVDAAPYFRIFNPMEQQKKFDNLHQYIKKWVPEWDKASYVKPIVDHKEARALCLSTYKMALENNTM
ncbi:MAG: deoxyribodipyrimidine photolyase [Flavobacterium sp. BFFFF2]|nr:MAG: deoxyribodipyrimidine photolyase [Flavobacterium sp. BFFFF2]